MGRKRIIRTEEEEQEHKKQKLEKQREYQRKYRERKKNEQKLNSQTPFHQDVHTDEIVRLKPNVQCNHNNSESDLLHNNFASSSKEHYPHILNHNSTDTTVNSNYLISYPIQINNVNISANSIHSNANYCFKEVDFETKSDINVVDCLELQFETNDHDNHFSNIIHEENHEAVNNLNDTSSFSTERHNINTSTNLIYADRTHTEPPHFESTIDNVQQTHDISNNLDLLSNQVHNYNTSFNLTQDHTYANTNNTNSCNLETAVTENYLGKMDIKCYHCKALHFIGERVANKIHIDSFNDCCSHGSVKLPETEFPQELKSLFNSEHELSSKFFKSIRVYNNLFSFASFNANIVQFNNRRPGPYCFKIHGQVYYQINTALHPQDDEKPSYGQLYIIDPNESIENRMSYTDGLDYDLIILLETIMRNYNVFAKSYVMMGEELQKLDSESSEELQLLFSIKSGTDLRRYNVPKINEVAAIFSTTADGEIPDAYVVIQNKNTKQLQRVSSMDPNVEPWIYPLLYPTGNQGWHRNLTRKDGKKRVSRAAYIKYQIAIRNNFNPFILGRRLFQQYLVDSYVKVEKDRIEYHKSHQAQLRISSYKGLMDYLNKRTNNDTNMQIGKIIILPSTFIGSPRYMLECYHDSMAIVRKKGKFDLFITMTCNPRWKEIEENLLPGQQPCDRPDLVARVFHLKKNVLLDFVVEKKFFGQVDAHIYVIEFQKRGLPHCHFLFNLSHKNKMNSVEIINKYVSAELPDPDTQPELFDIVINNMIHGPCGDWCLVDGKCSKGFPKPFQEETTIDADGRVTVRRRDTGIQYLRNNNQEVDNSWVVQYAPVLSLLLNCHINVEICSSTKSVKYLHKYLYKGHDAASIIVTNSTNEFIIQHDEIPQYLDSRYVGPVESVWRTLSRILQDKSHVIVRLPVHLPNFQNITIRTDPVDIDAAESDYTVGLQVSMLMDYFDLNVRDQEARRYYYTEIPEHYVFKKIKIDGNKVNRWIKRQRYVKSIGRMYTVNPSQFELFHLRILLLRVKGATSFEDLKTVNGELHETFSSACLAYGFIESDQEWTNAMREAVLFLMPKQLRRLFVRILIHCNPNDPKKLWEDFKDAMSEDFSRQFNKNQSYLRALIDVKTLIEVEGKSLDEFPQFEELMQIVHETLPGNEISENHLVIGRERYQKLNEKQKEIADKVLEIVMHESCDKTENNSTCFFIDGPGGSGKTFLYETLWYLLKGNNKNVCTMAFTGIAATLLPQGKTLHKVFKLPVPLFSDSSSNVKLESREAAYLKETDVFIWDEAPMAPRYAIEVMDRILRDIMNNDKLLGGKIFVLGGDFRQLLPVKINSTRTETVDLSINRCLYWRHFTKFSLTQNMRALPREIEFSRFLLNVGDGLLNDSHDNLSLEHFPTDCIRAIDKVEDIVNDIYGEVFRLKQYRKSINYAILSARNIDVNEINEKVVNLLDEMTEKIYTSIDSTENCDNEDFEDILLPEYLNTLAPPSLPPYELKLRLNCVVMLIRNLSISEGLCNGTRLLILNLSNNVLKCEILTGDKKGEIVLINRITLYSSETDYPFVFKRRQFPIKLAFAMTINKAQGQTLEKIGVDLRNDVFNHGQLYVALSRVRSWDSLKIYVNSTEQSSIKNYVYKELYL